jgi:hypothetical protein
LVFAWSALAQQVRLCDDVTADIQAGLADPFGAWKAWQPAERTTLADVFQCQEHWFRKQETHATPQQAAALHALAALKAFPDANDE